MAWNDKSFVCCRFSITSSPYDVYRAFEKAVLKEFLKFRYLALHIFKVISIITINDNFHYFMFNTHLFGLIPELTLMSYRLGFRSKFIQMYFNIKILKKIFLTIYLVVLTHFKVPKKSCKL